MAIDIALGDGTSAAVLSRTVRKWLNNPNALFRRVRDKHGQLRLSQNAKNYHPGRGVYRSAYSEKFPMVLITKNFDKEELLGKNWLGILNLDNEIERKIFEEYIKF